MQLRKPAGLETGGLVCSQVSPSSPSVSETSTLISLSPSRPAQLFWHDSTGTASSPLTPPLSHPSPKVKTPHTPVNKGYLDPEPGGGLWTFASTACSAEIQGASPVSGMCVACVCCEVAQKAAFHQSQETAAFQGTVQSFGLITQPFLTSDSFIMMSSVPQAVFEQIWALVQLQCHSSLLRLTSALAHVRLAETLVPMYCDAFHNTRQRIA